MSAFARENECMPEAPIIEWTLPADLLLEIVARSDARTLIRCAATSNLLRDDILDPSFIHRVTRQQGGIIPQGILAFFNTHDDTKRDPAPPPPLSLVRPVTTAAVSFLDDHMCPYMWRFAGDLLGERIPLAARGGLVLLRRRRHIGNKVNSNLCVYNLFTGHRTFFSDPPNIGSDDARYQLLTFADGIGCSFMLFVANLDIKPPNNRHIIQVQTATSTCGTWAPATMIHESSVLLKDAMDRDAVILHGGVLHWLPARPRAEIVTYNVCTMEQGTIQLPILLSSIQGQLHLGSYYSHDGRKLLRLLATNGFKIYVWYQLPDGDWTSEAVMIDTEEKLRSPDPNINIGSILRPEFKLSGEGSNTVVLRIHRYCPGALFMVLDIETKEMHLHEESINFSSVLLEVDLSSWLRTMKLFP